MVVLEQGRQGSDMRCAGIFTAVSLGLGAAVLPHRALADDWASEESQGRIELGARAVYLYTHGPISNQRYPELSAELFMTPRWSMEIAIGRSTHFTANCCDIDRSFGMTPLTWTLKYNFPLAQRLHPYLGFGWQHTDVSAPAHTHFSGFLYPGSSDGGTVQAGFDVLLSRSFILNADARYLDNLMAGQLRIDPYLISIGVAYRFASFH
jgi:outer membrane protein W